jgi:predicted nucleic acid-binding protein
MPELLVAGQQWMIGRRLQRQGVAAKQRNVSVSRSRPAATDARTDWWEAGHLIRRIGDAQGWDSKKRRDFQNDALIALTARRHGATVVTANRRDFGLLSRAVPFSLFAV